MIDNALGAMTAALCLGIPLETVASRLACLTAHGGRLRFHRLPSKALVIDDAYNASPASVRAAIDVLAQRPGHRVLVLGNMAELGSTSRSEHEAIGRYALEKGLDSVLGFGDETKATVRVFGEGQHFTSMEALRAALSSMLRPNSTCLIKGSRAMELDRLVRALLDTHTWVENA
jgi:UDP-N-acetylmuramyl pentapeptide synthase